MASFHPTGRCLATGLLALLLFSPRSYAQGDDDLELRVKAAFLYNFAKFVSWPTTRLPDATSPIVYCVLAGDPVAPALQDMLSGKSSDGHSLEIRRVSRTAEMRQCHIAYLGTLNASQLGAALGELQGSGALTVYDGDLAVGSAVVRLYVEERKVRFEINRAAANREGLQLSSRLLAVASLVRD